MPRAPHSIGRRWQARASRMFSSTGHVSSIRKSVKRRLRWHSNTTLRQMEDDPEVLPFHQRIDVQCDICGKVMTKGQFSTLVCFNCWGDAPWMPKDPPVPR
eukprot:g26830.t1